MRVRPSIVAFLGEDDAPKTPDPGRWWKFLHALQVHGTETTRRCGRLGQDPDADRSAATTDLVTPDRLLRGKMAERCAGNRTGWWDRREGGGGHSVLLGKAGLRSTEGLVRTGQARDNPRGSSGADSALARFGPGRTDGKSPPPPPPASRGDAAHVADTGALGAAAGTRWARRAMVVVLTRSTRCGKNSAGQGEICGGDGTSKRAGDPRPTFVLARCIRPRGRTGAPAHDHVDVYRN